MALDIVDQRLSRVPDTQGSADVSPKLACIDVHEFKSASLSQARVRTGKAFTLSGKV